MAFPPTHHKVHKLTSHSTQDIIDDRLPGASSSTIPPELRPRLLTTNPNNTTPRISLHTLETLYENLYAQRITNSDPSTWRFNVEPLAKVTSLQRDAATNKLRIQTINPRTGKTSISTRAFDVVISASGYEHSNPLLSNLEQTNLLQEQKVTVDADYKVVFRRDVVARDVGLWVLGSLEDGATRDAVFGFAAERGERVGASIESVVGKGGEVRGEVAML